MSDLQQPDVILNKAQTIVNNLFRTVSSRQRKNVVNNLIYDGRHANKGGEK
jgi:hypothetical protein